MKSSDIIAILLALLGGGLIYYGYTQSRSTVGCSGCNGFYTRLGR